MTNIKRTKYNVEFLRFLRLMKRSTRTLFYYLSLIITTISFKKLTLLRVIIFLFSRDYIFFIFICKSFYKSLISKVILNLLSVEKVFLVNNIFVISLNIYENILSIILNISSIRRLDIYYTNLYNL